MTLADIELATPDIGNGIRVVFTTTHDYLTGSLLVFVNGLVGRASDVNGWTELGTNRFQMKIAPLTGDQVSVYYRHEET